LISRIGEITETGNASDNHVITISDIKFEGNNLKVTIQSSKTDQIGNSTTLILPKDFISLSFFPNIAAVVAAPILKECVL
jgi:hypothetical protein